MTKKKPTLKQVRARLSRMLYLRDREGFKYDMVFGCDQDKTYIYPYVRVRAELLAIDTDVFGFEVKTDFSLPLGANLESAIHFKKAVDDAVKKTVSVHHLVDGLEWSRDEVMKEIK